MLVRMRGKLLNAYCLALFGFGAAATIWLHKVDWALYDIVAFRNSTGALKHRPHRIVPHAQLRRTPVAAFNAAVSVLKDPNTTNMS